LFTATPPVAPAQSQGPPTPPAPPPPLHDELHRRLTALEPDELTPRRALELLYELRQLANRLTSGGTEPS
jgi:DNA mismatch repair protein MutS